MCSTLLHLLCSFVPHLLAHVPPLVPSTIPRNMRPETKISSPARICTRKTKLMKKHRVESIIDFSGFGRRPASFAGSATGKLQGGQWHWDEDAMRMMRAGCANLSRRKPFIHTGLLLLSPSPRLHFLAAYLCGGRRSSEPAFSESFPGSLPRAGVGPPSRAL
ncbi:hypothetical protein C8R44DRAFT_239979 [Mycena epipterygia]|nr:hypothetical protein C8R44DRAFT_239979 [Mycena epipterygia]